jgi:hypothetical protein
MTQSEIRDRLLDLARVRLKARFGAFEQFRFTLDGLPAGAAILTRAALMPAPWTVGLSLGLDEAARQIDAHLLRIIDDWAQREAPARQIPALEGVQPLTAETQTQAPQAAPAINTKAKRRTWWDVSSPYIVEVMQAGQYATAKELYRALEAKAGPNGPFDRGEGANRGSLFVREISRSLSVHTVQNKWQTLRELAKK